MLLQIQEAGATINKEKNVSLEVGIARVQAN